VKSKTLEDYLALPYPWLITHTEEGYVIYVLDLPGCMTDADHWEDIPGQVREAMTAWIEASLHRGQPIPEPKIEEGPLPQSWRT
jgi:antitoxin HicB